MDPKRAEAVRRIQEALAAARAVGDPMVVYLLETALEEALRLERERIEHLSTRTVPLVPPKH